MKKILILITTAVIYLPSLTSACGNYRQVVLKTKTVPAQGFQNMTTETYQFYLDKDGREVRHGFSSQFDSAGNMIGRARYIDGKVWSGSVARIFLSCGIGASRSHFAEGKEIRREFLKGTPLFAGEKMGFKVNLDQILGTVAGGSNRAHSQTLELARR